MKSVFAFVLFFLLACQFSADNLCIRNKSDALITAKKILIEKYGEKVISEELPLTAKLENDSIWYIKGTLHAQKGGVAHLKLNAKNCDIIEIYHEK